MGTIEERCVCVCAWASTLLDLLGLEVRGCRQCSDMQWDTREQVHLGETDLPNQGSSLNLDVRTAVIFSLIVRWTWV